MFFDLVPKGFSIIINLMGNKKFLEQFKVVLCGYKINKPDYMMKETTLLFELLSIVNIKRVTVKKKNRRPKSKLNQIKKNKINKNKRLAVKRKSCCSNHLNSRKCSMIKKRASSTSKHLANEKWNNYILSITQQALGLKIENLNQTRISIDIIEKNN